MIAVVSRLLVTHVSMQEQDSAPQQSDLLLRLPEMNACFNQDSVEDIYTALKELDTEWSQATLKLLTGLVITLHDGLQVCVCVKALISVPVSRPCSAALIPPPPTTTTPTPPPLLKCPAERPCTTLPCS